MAPSPLPVLPLPYPRKGSLPSLPLVPSAPSPFISELLLLQSPQLCLLPLLLTMVHRRRGGGRRSRGDRWRAPPSAPLARSSRARCSPKFPLALTFSPLALAVRDDDDDVLSADDDQHGTLSLLP